MVLNLYYDIIDQHLRGFGPLIFHIGNSRSGEITCKLLELNRAELRDRRQERIEDLQRLVDKFNDTTIVALKQLIDAEIKEFIEKSEFTFVLRQFYEDQKLAS